MALYRIRQGVRALLAFSRPVDVALAANYLSPPLLALFGQMRRGEQLHSLRVLRAVLAQGETPRDLAIAALLHDVGKTRYPLRLWQKTLTVLTPVPLRQRLSQGDPRPFWRRPFAVYEHHPAWSADLIAAAGASETAVWLVAHHQDDAAQWRDHPGAQLLKRLQAADDAN